MYVFVILFVECNFLIKKLSKTKFNGAVYLSVKDRQTERERHLLVEGLGERRVGLWEEGDFALWYRPTQP